jgi:predicted TPR repeat methyltransferase
MAFRSGRAVEAVELLTQATRAAPFSAEVHDELGIVLRELKRFDEAEAACRKALSLNSRYAPAHVNLAEQFKRRGRPRDALEHLKAALQITPGFEPTRVSFGDVLMDLGETQAAVDLFRELAAMSASPAHILVRLGIALRTLGDMTGAIEACHRAVELAPQVPEAHYHLAESLVMAHRAPEALDHLKQSIQLPGARVLYDAALVIIGRYDLAAMPGVANTSQYLAILGNRLSELGHPAAALECFRRKLANDPWDTVAGHFVSALSGANPDRPRDEYVRQLFDNCADTFDQQLVEGLSYSVPRELVAAVVAAAPVGSLSWDVLDLGCGTGLVGVEIAPHARSLKGVDLSPKMIERARERGIYSELICGDLMVALGERGGPAAAVVGDHRDRAAASDHQDAAVADDHRDVVVVGDDRDGAVTVVCYDVVIAGDVFVYVGKLDNVIPAVRRALRPGGVLAFTVECAEDIPAAAGSTDYWLGPSGRYAHYADYIRGLASRGGFALKQMQKIRLRLENRQPMMGWLVILRAGER